MRKRLFTRQLREAGCGWGGGREAEIGGERGYIHVY